MQEAERFARSGSARITCVAAPLASTAQLPLEKYAVVLEGLVDTDAAYSYAPDVVERVRRLRAERFAFERRQGPWKAFLR